MLSSQNPVAQADLPVALSIAGSDNSAGAGIQADLKTFSALGVYGLTAVTCVVAEVPGKVSAIQAIEPHIVREQIRLSLETFPVGAIKTGMLYSREILEAVCEELESHQRQQGQQGPKCQQGKSNGRSNLVVDPVMVATSGTALLDDAAVEIYTAKLFGLASLVTPNLDETAKLLGRPIRDLPSMAEAGRELVQRFGCAFLLKGGHLESGSGMAIDLLVTPEEEVVEYAAPRVLKVKTHGTGCTMAAAIAAGLAKGFALPEAVSQAKTFISAAIAHSLCWKHEDASPQALHHFFAAQNSEFLLCPDGNPAS